VKKQNTNFSNPRGGAAIKVQIIPEAKQSRVKKISPDGLVILELAADQHSLNTALRNFLSDLFDISSDKLEVIEGGNHYDRLVCVLDLNVQAVNSALHNAVK
jgi:uncharacterized protein YggU (UPF0235/DUF167 family)